MLHSRHKVVRRNLAWQEGEAEAEGGEGKGVGRESKIESERVNE